MNRPSQSFLISPDTLIFLFVFPDRSQDIREQNVVSDFFPVEEPTALKKVYGFRQTDIQGGHVLNSTNVW